MGKRPLAGSITLDVALRRQGYDVRHHAANEEEIRVCCPFCVQNGQGPDTRYRLGINMRTGQAHCFNCAWKTGDIYKLLARASGVPVRENDDYYETCNKKKEARVLPDTYSFLGTTDASESIMGRRAVAYLAGRGVGPTQIKAHNIGYCHSGRYAYRVIFPIYRRGKLVTYIARDYTGKQEPRFLNMPGEKPLWNVEELEHVARWKGMCNVVLYEGIFKALAGESSIINTVHVATLGSHITELQLRDLSQKWVKSVTLFPDPNAVGLEGFLGIGHTLIGRGMPVYVVQPLPVAEADEMCRASLRFAFEDRVPFHEVSMLMAFEAAKRKGGG